MSAIQEIERATFGVGRLYATDSTGQRFIYAAMNDISIDLKTELKEYYSESTFAAGVANGHSSIDIQAKHYKLALKPIATDLGLGSPIASTQATAVDEVQTIASSTPYTATLTNAAQMIAGSELVYVTHVSPAGVAYDVPYMRVTATPVAGASYTIAAGVLTFAAGDAGLTIKVTYDYTNTNGQQITLNNVPQNSGSFYSMTLVKRDKSPIDGSTGLFIAKFNAVRAGGVKLNGKDDDWNLSERTFKAFQDPSGVVATFTFVDV